MARPTCPARNQWSADAPPAPAAGRQAARTPAVAWPLPQLPAGQQAADKLIAAASALLPEEAPSLFGAWCIADVDLAMMLQRLVQHGDPVPAPLERYARAQWEHFAVKRWLQLPR